MLEVKDLEVAYGSITALHGISLKVEKGKIVTLIGSNGAGKSTTLRAISGLRRVRRGKIFFEGHEITNRPPHRIVGQGLTQVPEGRMIFPNLTVLENLKMGAFRQKDKQEFRKDSEYVFQIFPRLKEREKQVAGTLSGGEQQMLAIGRALMTNPRLLILDEATEGLAPRVRDEIWQSLERLRGGGQSILVIDKNVKALTRIADRHYIIERGRIVWVGTSQELVQAPAIQHRYLGV